MTYKSLLTQQLNRISAHRRVLYLLESREFKIIYEKLKTSERAVVDGLVIRANDALLREFVLKRLEKDLDDLSIRELRLVASRYHIPYYSIKPKKELIDAIRSKQNLGDGDGTSRRTPTQISKVRGSGESD